MSFKKKDILKIVLLGDAQVGKKSLVQQFVSRKWSNDVRFDPFDAPKKLIAVEEKQVTLELYPVDSVSALTSVLNGSDYDGCILLYDLSNRQSFDSLPSHLDELLKHPFTPQPNLPIIVVANKYDLGSTKRAVQRSDANDWIKNLPAAQRQIELYEASAKTADHIDTAFYRIARLALKSDHNMLSGGLGNSAQIRLCGVEGCNQVRTHRAFCASHAAAIERGNFILLRPELHILPPLAALNTFLQNQKFTKSSPFHLALLGSIRQLYISLNKDKESTYQLYPQVENDIYQTVEQQRTAAASSPRNNAPVDMDANRGPILALPKVFYQSILDINTTLNQFITHISSADKKSTKDGYTVPDQERVATSSVAYQQFSAEYLPQRNKPPILDISLTSNVKVLAPNYLPVTKSLTGRRIDLRHAVTGKDLFLCYLRDQPPAVASLLNGDESCRWTPYANGMYPNSDTLSQIPDDQLKHEFSSIPSSLSPLQLRASLPGAPTPAAASKKTAQKPVTSKDGANALGLDLLAQLLPLTAINVCNISRQHKEAAPFGFETVSNMSDSSLAQLANGNHDVGSIFLALHRAGPGPDYNLYACDLFGDSRINRKNFADSSSLSPLQSFSTPGTDLGRTSSVNLGGLDGELTRHGSMITPGALRAAPSNLSPHDMYTLTKRPLTILTEDSRSMTPNYPICGSRGCGAPIIDINLVSITRETIPVDWHALNVTLLNHRAVLLNSSRHETSVVMKIDVEPVLQKVYRPFLEILHARKKEANVLGVDNNILIQFTHVCAILTTCLYSPQVSVVLEAFKTIRAMLAAAPPPPPPAKTPAPSTATPATTANATSPSSTPAAAAAASNVPSPPAGGASSAATSASPQAAAAATPQAFTPPPQIFNAFIHTICDAVPLLMGILYDKDRCELLEVLQYIMKQTYSILSSYTVLRIIDIFALLRCCDMHVSDPNYVGLSGVQNPDVPASSIDLVNNPNPVTASALVLNQINVNNIAHLSSSFMLKYGLMLLKPIVTGANQSSLSHATAAQFPMASLDPKGTYTRLNTLVAHYHQFADPVFLGSKKKMKDSEAKPLLTKTKTPGSPLAAPPTLPSVASQRLGSVQIEIIHDDDDDNHPSRNILPSVPDHMIATALPTVNPVSAPASTAFPPGPPKLKNNKSGGNDPQTTNRTSAEINTIITNINNNPYDMCASLLRFLADQVVSSKIADQEIGRLLRRSAGSQPLGDLACITDRLIMDHSSQRNWLIDPPIGYAINPSLRVKHQQPSVSGFGIDVSSAAASSVPSGLPTFQSLSSPTASGGNSGLDSDPSSDPSGLPTFSSLALGQSGGIPTLESLMGDQSASSNNTSTNANSSLDSSAVAAAAPPSVSLDPQISTLQQTFNPRYKGLSVDVTAKRPSVLQPAGLRSGPYSTFTPVFHDDPDVNPDGSVYKWRYFTLQIARNETEQERRTRRKKEKAGREQRENEAFDEMMEEHQSELTTRRVTIHNTQHMWNAHLVIHKSERILLSLLIYFCKLASSEADAIVMHTSSVAALGNVNIFSHNSIAQSYKAVTPFSTVVKEESILRRVYALQLVHYILDKSDGFLKSNHASVNVIRRYIVPAIIHNAITVVPAMFFISLRCFVILCEKYNLECQAEIGLLLNDVFLEMLICSATPVEFKVHIFELLELVLNSPTKVINLYQTQDNSGQRNVYEKLLQTVSIVILQTQNSKSNLGSFGSSTPFGNASTSFKLSDATSSNTAVQAPPADAAQSRINDVVHQYNADNHKTEHDAAAEKLRKCSLRLMMHQLHMLAQWSGVPSLRRTPDAVNALKLTCKSYLHVLICSQNFPEIFFTTPQYSNAIEIATKKLTMFFEAFSYHKGARPYIQMPGILEELLRTQGEGLLKQLLGLNSGLTRSGTIRSNVQGVMTKNESMSKEVNLVCLSRALAQNYPKIRSAAASPLTIQQAQVQYRESVGNFSVLGHSQLGAPHVSSYNNPLDLPTPTHSVANRQTISNGLVGGQTAAHRGSISVTAPPAFGSPLLAIQNNGTPGAAKQTAATANYEEYDMDGGYIKVDDHTNTAGKLDLENFSVSIDSILGSLPDMYEGLEMGLDLGHYSAMDSYTVSLVKKNPAFGLMLTSCSPLSKQRNEYLRVYTEASLQAQGQDSLKKMLAFLHTKYPRWLTPYNIAQLLYQNPYMTPEVVGDYFTSQDDKYFNIDQFNQLRTAYTNLIDLSGMPFVAALRYYLTSAGFRMPGEGQKVDRTVTAFCQTYLRDNPDEFPDLDVAILTCFATIMLNTELHNPNTLELQKQQKKGKKGKPPMTVVEFVKNVKSSGKAGRRLDIQLLVGIFLEISGQAIEWVDDAAHFDTSLTLQQLMRDNVSSHTDDDSNSNANTSDNVDNNIDDENTNSKEMLRQQKLRAIRTNIRNQGRLRLLRRRALCGVRAVGPIDQRNDVTSSTQVMSILWSHVGQYFLRSVASKMDSSPFFAPQKKSTSKSSQQQSAIDKLRIDEVDHETLHMCIDCLAYGCAVSISLGFNDMRKSFMRSLAKIVYLETQCSSRFKALQDGDTNTKDSKENKSKDEEYDMNDHFISPQIQNQLLSGEHYKQTWYSNLDSLSQTNPVLACKMLLSITTNTKASISFQRRQQILHIMQTEFGGRENINLSADTSRAFLKKGVLIKVNSNGKKQAYSFFLFNDILIYAEEEGKDRYKIHQVLHLSMLRLVSSISATRAQQEQRTAVIKRVQDLRQELAALTNNTAVTTSTTSSGTTTTTTAAQAAAGSTAITAAATNSGVLAKQQALLAELNKIVIPPEPTARFRIISPQKSFVVECPNESVMNDWITLMQDCITKLLVKRSDWCNRAKTSISDGIICPDLIAAKKIPMKKDKYDNKEDIIMSMMDPKGGITKPLNTEYEHNINEYQNYIKQIPKNHFPVSIDRSLQLKKFATFSGSSADRLRRIVTEGVFTGSSFCKLCLRPYAFRRSMKTCQHCGEDVCSDCCKNMDVLIQPMLKVRSIRACYSCYGFVPSPTNEEGRGLVGDNQPVLEFDDADEM